MALDDPQGQVEDAGDLVGGALLDDGEPHDRATRLAELAELVGEQDAVGEAGVTDRLLGTLHPGDGRDVADGAVTLGPDVGDPVPGDPDEPPGHDTLTGAQGATAVPGRDEDLLRDVLGVVVVAERAQRHGADQGRPAMVGLLQRGAFTGPQTLADIVDRLRVVELDQLERAPLSCVHRWTRRTQPTGPPGARGAGGSRVVHWPDG